MLFNIWLTNRCNLKCPYCYVGVRQKEEMTNETKEKIVDFISLKSKIEKRKKEEKKHITILYFGGEPLLRFDLITFFTERIKEKITGIPIFFHMTTNGTLLTKEKIDYFKENKLPVTLSIDGLPEIHDYYRKFKNGKGSWAIIEKNIGILLKELPDSYARLTFTSQTVPYLRESVRFLVDLGFRNIKPVPDFFDPKWEDENFKILEKQTFQILEDYLKEYIHKDIEITFLKHKREIKKYGICDGGINEFYILPSGEIYPCNYVANKKEFCLGNVSEPTKVEIPLFLNLKTKRELCRGCAYFDFCESKRCTYLNFAMTGKPDEPNGFFCSYEKLLFKIAEKLKRSEIDEFFFK
ncbi:MAG: radical SAM protein [Candidatus Pacebacteria bacterium]|nr:radical SAM protein [Candidatus Paceibacterota bacterium]